MSAQERKGTQPGGSASPKTISIAEGQKFCSERTASKIRRQNRVVSQRVEDNAFHPGSRARAQRDHLAQHAQAVAEKTNFAAFGMVPTHWNFANPQTGPMRAIKQLHVEREAFDLRRFKNRSARLETKRFKSALRVPKRQSGSRSAPAN